MALPLAAKGKYCFENAGEKKRYRVTFEVKNNRILGGRFQATPAAGGEQKLTRFAGTKTGTVLTVSFTGKAPYPLAPGTETILWSLGEKQLAIPFYSRGAKARRAAERDVVFAACADSP